MASFKDSLYGGLSGKIGPVTTYLRKGVQVVRANTKPRDPKTPKQLAHRMKFSLVNKDLSPLNSAIKLGHNGDTDAYRTIVGKAYHEAIVGEYPNFTIDYSKIKISDGDLQLPADFKLELDESKNCALFIWDEPENGSLKKASGSDMLNVVCYNMKFGAVEQMPSVARRLEKSASVILPKGWKLKETHFWVYFSSHVLQTNSESLYVK